MNMKDQLEEAGRIVACLVNYETPVTVSHEVVIGTNGTPAPRYKINLGDVCDHGRWKWVCAFGDTLDQCVDSASVQCAAQADKRSIEIRDLTKRARELGLVVTEVEGKQNV